MTEPGMLRTEFARHFGGRAQLFRAPGRVNLIGEHTDYNAGLVMPAAIGFYTTVAATPRSDGRVRVRSTNFSETVAASLANLDAAIHQRRAGVHWADYVWGVIHIARQHGIAFKGADLLIHGEVPLGSGLSSSAALEVAVALALSSLAGAQMAPLEMARLCQRAENEYVGNRCGIMDQYASACGRAGHALLIDCRSLEHQQLPLALQGDDAARLVICNTMVRHQLAGGEYNRRREQCEQGVRTLARRLPHVETLRDVSAAELAAHREALDPIIHQRCRHVISENERVLAAAQALQAADLAGFGALMGESHRSLRDDYEVSCAELDLMVRLAGEVPGVFGARMTGGGFGGCTVNLVRAAAVAEFVGQVTERYQRATGHRPEIHVCEAADGAAALG